MLSSCRLRAAALALLLFATNSLAQINRPTFPPEKLMQVRTLLKKHCSECHLGVGGRSDSTLDILDHAALVSTNRPRLLIKPNEPNESILLQLVEEGSMPPAGKPKLTAEEVELLREWTAKGAPAFPRAFNELHVLQSIHRDIEGFAVNDRKSYRYVSFAHLLKTGTPSEFAEVLKSKGALEETLTFLARNPRAGRFLEPIDGIGSVYRLDLRNVGFEKTPFYNLDLKSSERLDVNKSFTIWDLVLLEYPYARIYPGVSRIYDLVKRAYLTQIPQVRPIAYLPGDWLQHELTKGASADDIRALLHNDGKAPARKEANPVPSSQVMKLDMPEHFYLDVGRPLVPLNAHGQPEIVPRGWSVKLRVVDPKTGKTAPMWKAKSCIDFEVAADKDLYFSGVYFPAQATTDKTTNQFTAEPLEALHKDLNNKPFRSGANVNSLNLGGDGKGLLLEETGKHWYIVFASEKPLPKLLAVSAGPLSSPIVRVYFSTAGGTEARLAEIWKTTVIVEVVP